MGSRFSEKFAGSVGDSKESKKAAPIDSELISSLPKRTRVSSTFDGSLLGAIHS